MPLERIHLRNFQSHDKLVVEFDPRVTVVVGPSDVGKSAIIRALRWVATNKPGGDAFIKEGTKATTVTLHVDGHRIDRRRSSGGENVYRLDEEELRAFGADVPTQISELLRLSEVNFQGQHDTPFWFAETSGEVSRRLNAVVDLSSIDELQATVTAKARTAKTVADLAETRLTDLKQRKDKLKDIENVDADLRKLEAAQLHLDAAKEHAGRLSLFLSDLEDCKQVSADETARSSSLSKVLQAARLAVDSRHSLDVLTILVHEIRENRLLARKAAPDTSALDTAKNAVDLAQDRAAALREFLDNLHQAFVLCRRTLHESSVALTAFHLATKDERCPLCEHPLT